MVSVLPRAPWALLPWPLPLVSTWDLLPRRHPENGHILTCYEHSVYIIYCGEINLDKIIEVCAKIGNKLFLTNLNLAEGFCFTQSIFRCMSLVRITASITSVWISADPVSTFLQDMGCRKSGCGPKDSGEMVESGDSTAADLLMDARHSAVRW